MMNALVEGLRGLAVQLYVLGLVDHTHPAASELFDNTVVRDGLADHSAQGCNVRSAYEASQQNGGTLCWPLSLTDNF